MSVSNPFRLTSEDVRRADLAPSDIGLWCVIVGGCYHLFHSESSARKAYDMILSGAPVR